MHPRILAVLALSLLLTSCTQDELSNSLPQPAPSEAVKSAAMTLCLDNPGAGIACDLQGAGRHSRSSAEDRTFLRLCQGSDTVGEVKTGVLSVGRATSRVRQISSGVVYERTPRAAVAAAAASSGTAGTLPAETPFGSDASNPASKIGATGPFQPLQQIPATLMTAIRTPGGGSVPVVAVTADGGSFVGLATINATLARVDMQFRRYVAADGKISAIDALAYSNDANGLTQGLAAEIQAVAPTLALDAAQNSANALNTYVQNVASAAAKNQGTSINIGDNLTLSGPSVATLAQTLVGGLGSTFRMPENAQSITRIATVKGSVPMIVIAGLGGEGR